MHALPSILDLTGIMTITKGKPEAGKGAGTEDAGFAGLLDLQAKSLISKSSESAVDAEIAHSGDSAVPPMLPEVTEQTAAIAAPATVTTSPEAKPVVATTPVADTGTPEIEAAIALPDSGKTGKSGKSGKSLPVSLPVAGKAAKPAAELRTSITPNAEPKRDTAPAAHPRSDAGHSKTTDASAPLPTHGAAELAALLAALPAATAAANPVQSARAETAKIPAAPAASPAPSALAMLKLPEVANGKSGTAKGAQQNDSKPADQAAAPAVTLSVANSAETTGSNEQAELPQRDASSSQGKPAAPAAEVKQSPTLPLPANDTAPAMPAADALPLHRAPTAPHTAAPQAAEARPDLTEIVERLAVAREAMAPANGEISFEHREFGELSLRFDQYQDGRLQVALSARDAEAHRAVAAAMAADRGQFSGGDQQQQHSASQQSMNSQQRPASGDRDTASGGQNNHFARQDQRGGQPASRQRPARHSDSGSHGGIFA